MWAIYKYEISVPTALPAEELIHLPEEAKIITAEMQDGKIVIYAWVNAEAEPVVECVLRFIGTGNPFMSGELHGWKHLNTLMVSPAWVVHVFAMKGRCFE